MSLRSIFNIIMISRCSAHLRMCPILIIVITDHVVLPSNRTRNTCKCETTNLSFWHGRPLCLLPYLSFLWHSFTWWEEPRERKVDNGTTVWGGRVIRGKSITALYCIPLITNSFMSGHIMYAFYSIHLLILSYRMHQGDTFRIQSRGHPRSMSQAWNLLAHTPRETLSQLLDKPAFSLQQGQK